MNILDELENFLLNEIVLDLGIEKKSFTPDEDLLTQEILDSLSILKFIDFIEEKFGLQFTDEEIVPEKFVNLNCLKEFIESKQQR